MSKSWFRRFFIFWWRLFRFLLFWWRLCAIYSPHWSSWTKEWWSPMLPHWSVRTRTMHTHTRHTRPISIWRRIHVWHRHRRHSMWWMHIGWMHICWLRHLKKGKENNLLIFFFDGNNFRLFGIYFNNFYEMIYSNNHYLKILFLFIFRNYENHL